MFGLICLGYFAIHFYFLTKQYLEDYQKIDWDTIEHKEPRVPCNEEFEVLMLGGSHANMYKELESALGKKVITLGTGGGGVLVQQAYTEYFFKKGNTAKYTLYIIDPVMLYTDRFDTPKRIKAQKFDKDLLVILFKKFGFNWTINTLKNYKTYYEKINKERKKKDVKQRIGIDSVQLVKELEHLFERKSKDAKRISLSRQKKKFFKTIEVLKKNSSKLIFCIPPTLFGENELFYPELLDFLQMYKEKFGTPFYDFKEEFNHPDGFKNFYDHSHLNEEGRSTFATEYLVPIFEAN